MEAQIEQLNDIPVLFSIIQRMNIMEAIDNIFIPHQNWIGLSVGELTAIWLCYLISTQDHRLSYFEEWARDKMQMISILLDKEVSISNFSDDKLELLLGYFSEQAKWNKAETDIDKEVIRVYDLETDIIRVDATIGKSFRKVVSDGLFQYGSSKHFRTDLPQFKTMLSTIDPFGYPLCNLTVSGNSADDPLYIPVIEKSMDRLTGMNSLFVGDCKLGSFETRAFINKKGYQYFCPLSGIQVSNSKLIDYINKADRQQIELTKVWKEGKVIAKGYITTEQLYEIDDKGNLNLWTENRYIVRSYVYTRKMIETLVKRIKKCTNDLLKLNERKQGRKSFKEENDLEVECQRIIKKYNLEGLINFVIDEETTIKHLRKWRDRPARKELIVNYTVTVVSNDAGIALKKKTMGWQIYGSNCTNKNLTLEKAILLYRKEYIIERRFDYLKNKPLNLLPIYLHKDKYVIGLINILLLCLRIISLIELSVAKNLDKMDKKIAGLYAGNPKMKTANPSAMLILRTFLNIYSITTVDFKNKKMECAVTTLSPFQKKILRLMNLSEQIYEKFIKCFVYEQNNVILKN